MSFYKTLFFTVFMSFVFASNYFNLEEHANYSKISFNVGTISFEEEGEYKKIKSDSKGLINIPGEPELPTYSFSYAVDRDIEYNVEYNVISHEVINNINLYPSQNIVNQNEFIKKENLYLSNSKYPTSNLTSKRMSLRGNDLLGIELVPFEYDFENQSLKIFTSVEIIITESNSREASSAIPRSKVFEDIFNNMTINQSSYQDSRNYQQPSILYIVEDYTTQVAALMETLAEWRRKNGYVVTIVDRDQTGSSSTSIRNYIEDAYYDWENPPEFVCLVGDANGSYEIPTFSVGGGGGWSGAYGEGDFPYVLIEGDDLLPDMFIGRMSIRSSTELATVINKIIGYEKNYSNDDDWLHAAALVGDPYDSGISTVITNQYIEQIMDIHGGIDDVRTKYSGSNFDGFMREQINEGVSFLNYRGFYGFSNFDQNDVNQLNNGYKLPFLMTLTCDTGSFSEDTECISEGLFRAGTSVNPKGAVAVVATAQPYTHTAFNNIVTMGMYEGLFINGAKTAGETLAYGQIAINEIYPQNPNNNVYYFSSWNNLMGDPSTQIWTSAPIDLIVDHEGSINMGSNSFSVQVYDNNGSAFEGASVSLYKKNGNNIEFQLLNSTDENGYAMFNLDGYNSGEVSVVTNCQNCMPVETSFSISNQAAELVINENSILVDDSSGNNDGYFNPSETIEISFDINNLSIQSFDNLEVSLFSLSEHITVNNSNVSINNLGPGGTMNVSGLILSSSSNMLDFEDPSLKINILSTGSNNLSWQFNLPLNFLSGSMSLNPIITNDDNNNGMLDRGESATLNISLLNSGSINLNNLVADLNNYIPFVTLSSSILNWGNLDIGQTSNAISSIEIYVDQNIVNGTIVNIPLSFSTSNGFTSNEVIQLQVGQVSVNDPLGPDSYGYYIYDEGDEEYELAPEYDWIEIDPDLGGDGTELNINDDGNNGDDVTTIDLPFTFTFYGIDYNELSISSNGWISFGETEMTSFRNYTLPGPGGPSPIVAVFWDDLKTTSGGEVYSYYDASNDSFIIEWSNVRTYFNNSTETFQVILYNTGWQTHTGDDEIKIQFKDFNNNSIGDYPVGNYNGAVVHGQYCTVGIENHLQNDGLEYTYNNTYPLAARPLSDNSAIFISTRNSSLSAIADLSYSNDSFTFDLDEGEQGNNQLSISNVGEPGSVLYYDVDIAPFSSAVDQMDDFGYAWAQSNVDVNIDYDWIDIEDNHTVLEFDSNDGGALVSLGFPFPFYGNQYVLCAAMANGWIAFDASNEEWNNSSIFDDDAPRAAILAFWDDLNPVSGDNETGQGYVKYHANNDRVVIWYDSVVHWTSLERVYDFQVVLYPSGEIDINYREMIGDTGSATIGIIDANGNYGLEVLYNQDNFIQDEMSISFNTAPDWIEILSGDISGQLLSGDSENFSFAVNSSNLNNGVYNAYFVINTNATIGSIYVPVAMNVGSLMLGDVNQDGIFNILDVVSVVAFIMGSLEPNGSEAQLADLNEDGVVDILDVVNLVNLVLS